MKRNANNNVLPFKEKKWLRNKMFAEFVNTADGNSCDKVKVKESGHKVYNTQQAHNVVPTSI